MICHKYNTTCTAVDNLYSKIYTCKVSSKIAAEEEISMDQHQYKKRICV